MSSLHFGRDDQHTGDWIRRRSRLLCLLCSVHTGAVRVVYVSYYWNQRHHRIAVVVVVVVPDLHCKDEGNVVLFVLYLQSVSQVRPVPELTAVTSEPDLARVCAGSEPDVGQMWATSAPVSAPFWGRCVFRDTKLCVDCCTVLRRPL